MRIVVHGQQAFGKAVLERLLERGENVVAVCCAPTKPGKPEDPLAKFAQEKGLPVHQLSSWKTPEALALMQSFNADLCMMAYVLLFVPREVLDAPKYGSFQYHPSLLPWHRGPSSINWPISQGKNHTGLSIFWPNDGLDEGPIFLQKTCAIGPNETIGDIYFNKLFPMGVDAMLECLDLVKAGVILKHTQDLDAGSYESWFKKDLVELDWSKPVADVYNAIRAANPAPGAWCTIKGSTFDIFDSERVDGSAKAGKVLAISEDGITVAADGGAILVKRVRGADRQKVSASDFAQSIGIAVGDEFDAPARRSG